MTGSNDASEPELAIQWPTPHSGGEDAKGWPRLDRALRLGVMASGHGSNFEALVLSLIHISEPTRPY